MATAQLDTLLRHIRKLAAGRGSSQRSDSQLLDDFSTCRDETAFAALVARHGPMVLRVCRRVLNHEQDAEDAFQATFLVLARKTGSIRKRAALAEWLHGVAYRTAMQAKRSAARRRNHEARLRASTPKAVASPTWDDVQAVLDQEIQRLPEAFRTAFVLCVLEGKSGPQAAAELGVKEGTVWSRLTRARQRLQQQLARRGLELSVLLAALSVAEGAGKAAVPTVLANATLRSGLLAAAGGTAAGVIPSHIAALAAGVTRAMFLTKAKIAIAMLFAASVVTNAGIWTHQLVASKDVDEPQSRSSQPVGQEGAKARAPAAAPKSKPGETPVYRGGVLAVPAGVPALPPGQALVYRGRVLGPDGKPVAGAKLYLVLPPGGTAKTVPVRATTESDGRFDFTAVRAEFLPADAPADVDVFSYLQVVAVAKDYGPDWTMMRMRPIGELTLRLVKNDANIAGRILDLEGKAVAGAKVRVVRVETTLEDDLAPFLRTWKSQPGGQLAVGQLTKILYDPSVAGLPKTVTTGADGRFCLPGAGNERIVMLSLEAPRIEHATIRVLPRTAVEVKALVGTASERMMIGQLAPPTIYGLTFD